MKKMLIALMAAALASEVLAAETFTKNGIVYVVIQQFAQENNLKFTDGASGITLKGTGRTVLLYPYSTTATLNGSKFTLTGAVVSEGKQKLAPLVNLQRAFGIQTSVTTTRSTRTVTTTTEIGQPMPQSAAPSPTTAVEPAPLPYRVSFSDSRAAEGLLSYPNIEWSFANEITADSAYNACIAATEALLKAPATAQFGDYSSVTSYPNKVWGVYGTVDSQNGYGALVRSGFSCVLRRSASLFSPIFVDITTRR